MCFFFLVCFSSLSPVTSSGLFFCSCFFDSPIINALPVPCYNRFLRTLVFADRYSIFDIFGVNKDPGCTFFSEVPPGLSPRPLFRAPGGAFSSSQGCPGD